MLLPLESIVIITAIKLIHPVFHYLEMLLINITENLKPSFSIAKKSMSSYLFEND